MAEKGLEPFSRGYPWPFTLVVNYIQFPNDKQIGNFDQKNGSRGQFGGLLWPLTFDLWPTFTEKIKKRKVDSSVTFVEESKSAFRIAKILFWNFDSKNSLKGRFGGLS